MKTGLVIALVVLVIFSGFFSATETAYTSFSSVRMRRFAQKKRSARLALRLSEDYNRVLTTLLIGNNIVNLTASTIGTLLFVSLLGEGLGATVSTVLLCGVSARGVHISVPAAELSVRAVEKTRVPHLPPE